VTRARPFAVNYTLLAAFASTLFTMLMVYMMLNQIAAQARSLDELRRSDVAALRAIGTENRRLLRAVAEKVGVTP
jgi:hypothetical protein